MSAKSNRILCYCYDVSVCPSVCPAQTSCHLFAESIIKRHEEVNANCSTRLIVWGLLTGEDTTPCWRCEHTAGRQKIDIDFHECDTFSECNTYFQTLNRVRYIRKYGLVILIGNFLFEIFSNAN